MNNIDRPIRLIHQMRASGETLQPASARRPLQRASRLLSLEQRFMFDAAAVTTAVDAAQAQPDAHVAAEIPDLVPPTQVREVDASLNNGRKEVVFVDTSVTDYKTLEASIRAGMEIQEIDHGQSGLAQIAKWAESHDGYDAIHILSHGNDAILFLGSDAITADMLSTATAQAELAELGRALKIDGDLLVYGCDVGNDATGLDWTARLAQLTGADVATSTDDTGTSNYGGNWTLERQQGQIDTASPFDAQAIQSYSSLLATFDLSGATGTGTKTIQQTVGSDTIVITATDENMLVDTEANAFGSDVANAAGTVMATGNGGVSYESKVRIAVSGSKIFDLSSLSLVDIAGESKNLKITTDKGTETITANFAGDLSWAVSFSGSMYEGISYAEITTGHASNQFAWGFDNIVLNNITTPVPAPTVIDANISITSSGSGTGGAYKIGDTVTASWNNTAGGDNNAGITGVTMDFSTFGGGSAVVATNSSGTWTASYTITSGAIDGTNRNVSVTASNGNNTTTADTTNLTLDNIAPTVTDGRISISGGSGTGGAYKIGDTVTASWNNTAGGDNNADTTSNVTVDFSAFGGGAAVAATNSSDTWTATYTITAGAIDGANKNVSVTATDNAGNTTTTADTTNATVDNVAPTVTNGNISISGGSGTGGAYKIGDTITAIWNNTAGGDNNSDTISGVTIDFSQFGGGAAVTATNSSGTWTATYTIVSGAINGTTNRNVSVTTTDNAGNATTTSDTTNATVDNVAPTITFNSIAFSADTGDSSSDFITATAAQTITATLSGAPAGSDIVYGSLDNGSTWTDITGKVSGTTLTWDGVTLSGSNILSLKVTDATGNDGTSASQAYTLDTSAPSAPSTPNMTAGTDSGSSSNDDITSDTTPTFLGTAEANSTVTLYDTDGTTVLGTTTANGAGNWLLTSSALSAGSHTITAKATDAAGNISSASSGLSATIDTAAPTGLGLSATTIATLNATSTSTIATLSSTDGLAVTYSLAVGNGTNDADNGSFTVTGTSLKVGGASLTAGTYKLYMAATDTAGNVANQAFTITIVDAPSVSSVVRTGGASATVNTSATSIDYTITFSESVTGVDTSDFALTATGTASGNIASISGSGTTYTVTVDTLSGDGTLRLDLNGSGTGIQNGSSVAISGGYTSGSTYTLDHTAPSASSTPDMSSGTDSGTSSSDDITSDNTPTFTGTAESGSTVTLYDTDGTTVLGTATATGGNWSITSSALSEGSHTVTAKATDAAGNVSSASSGLSVTIDTTVPSVASVSVPGNGSYKAGQTLSFTVNSSETVTVDTSGGTPRLALTVGGSTVYANYASGSGSDALTFTYTVQAGDADGDGITVTAMDSNGGTLRDTAGNNLNLTLNSVGATTGVLVDTTAPTVTDAKISLSGATGTGGAFRIGDTVTATWNNTGGGDNNSDISGVTVDFSQFGGGATVAATNSSGTWSATYTIVSGAIDATNRNISITATDNAGNTATTADTANATVDNAAPTITFSNLAFSSDTGTSSTDFLTGTAAQTITATLSGAPAGTDIVYGSLDNGAIWTDITGKVSGTTLTWDGVTLTSSSTLQLKVTDAAGNDGTAASQAYTLDTTAPATTIASAAFSADTGTSSTDFLTNTAAQTISGTLSANLASGETVYVSLDNGTTWTAASATVGQNIWSLAGQTLTASSTLRMKVTDAAGNDGSTHSQAYVLDTTGPSSSTGALTIQENPADGSAAGTLASTDSNGPVVFSLTDSAGGRFAINASTGAVQVADGSLIDFETADQHAITIRTEDAAGNTTDTARTVLVTDANEAPTLTAGSTISLTGTNENTASSGTLVSDILSASSHADVDANALSGVVVTAASGNGTWQYSTDGSGWHDFGNVSGSAALALSASSQVRYLPDGNNGETASFTYRAWDQTAGSASSNSVPVTLDASATGGSSAFSAHTGTASIAITAVNDAPALAAGADLTTITEDDTANAGQTVASFATDISEVDDDGAGIFGIAIEALDSGNGTWQFSIDGGAWTNVGDVSASNALLLRSTDKVRFVPDGEVATSANLTYRAWDRTAGSAGDKADVTANGGQSAFSTNTVSAAITATDVNDAPTGDLTIQGDFIVGETLTASHTLEDVDLGKGAVTYTWKDSDGNVVGTGSTLLLTQELTNKIITVTASYTDGKGTAEAVTKAATGTVVFIPPVPQSQPVVEVPNPQPSAPILVLTPAPAPAIEFIPESSPVNLPVAHAVLTPVPGPGTTPSTPVTPVLVTRDAGPTLTTPASAGGFQATVIPRTAGGPDTLVVNQPLSNLTIETGGKISIHVSPSAFAHTDPGAVVTLTAQTAEGTPLPAWLAFDPQSGKFDGTPPPGFKGTISIRVIARDAQGQEAIQVFEIEIGERRVGERGQLPLQRGSLPEHPAVAGRPGLSEQLQASRHGTSERLSALSRSAQAAMAISRRA